MLQRFLTLLTLIAGFGQSCFAKDFVFSHENVLGTSMQLRFNAANLDNAKAAEKTAINELERLEKIYSSYDANSELSRFSAAPVGQEFAVSPELYQILRQSEQWQHTSQKTFNPAIERLSQLWETSADVDRRPSGKAIQSTLSMVNRRQWKLNPQKGTATRLQSDPLSLNAIAKGVILDRIVAAVMPPNGHAPEIKGVMIDIGGDIRVAGKIDSQIAIANPADDVHGGQPLTNLQLTAGGIATSGHTERSHLINGRLYSHIIDPRTGQPVAKAVSATVVAPDASTADVLATICTILSVQESIALVNSIPGVECLIYSDNIVLAASMLWPQTVADSSTKSNNKGAAKDTGHEMLVEFEISNAGGGRRYRRPYVAVWIEDADKFPVKTLSLFLMQNNPGPRWYRDVRRWYSDDQMRRLADPTDLIKTVSKPTRNPGKYKVKWDGRDDAGKLVGAGKYTLLIEAAREHGTYQLIKQEFEFGTSFAKKLKGNAEIGSAAVDYKAK